MSTRVVMLAPSISRRAGGLLDCVRNLSHYLQDEQNTQIDVVSIEDEFSGQDRPLWKDLPVHLVAPKYSQFCYAPQLLPQVLALAPDLVHTHGLWTYLSIVALHWSHLNKKSAAHPYLISPQGMLDSWALQNARWKKIIAGIAFERRHLKKAACIHAVTESEAEAIRAFGLRNPICIVPNGVEVPMDNAPRLAPPWDTDIADGHKVLLYLGRLHPKKGLSLLLRGWEKTSKAKSNWTLIIAGWDQGGHQSELEQLARALHISDSVRFIGPIFGNGRDAAYQHADALVLPSLSEGQPLVVLEAWSHARPVIMTPQCNLVEGFDQGAAIRMNPTPAGACEALDVLCTMGESALAEMGRHGRELVVANFSWSRCADQMASVYQWLLGQSVPPDFVIFN